MIKKILLSALIIVSIQAECFASSPMEAIKKPTNNIIDILQSEKYETLTPDLREEQWEEIWIIVKDSFDFSLISRLAVGKYWSSFSDEQKEQFQTLFAQLLANTYINKVQENFKSQEVIFKDEKISDDKAEVLIDIEHEDKPVPVIYRLIKKDRWLIYDVKIEGMSMVRNYRSQFDEYLFKKSPKDLIKALDSKIEKLKIERKKPIDEN